MNATHIEKTAQRRAEAKRLNLLGCEILDRLTLEELAAIDNGIGPEWFPEWARKTLDKLSPSLRPATMIHDVEYKLLALTYAAFTGANARLEANGVIIANDKYGWYNPLRYIVRQKARRYADLCQQFGWSAFVAAHADGTLNGLKQPQPTKEHTK